MRSFRPTLVAGALAFALSAGTASAQFSNAYFFGDSLTDTGSYKPVLPPGTGLFTTNPGPVWVAPFTQYYGLSASPANQGGNDYAEGGARVTSLPGVPNTPPTGTATPVSVQVANFLSKGPADPNAIYSVWAGANDLFYQLGLAQAGLITTAQLQANLGIAATDLVKQIATLNAAGAKYIVVFNVPDIGKTPFGVGSGSGAQITALSSFFNSTLYAGLDATGIQTIRFNAFAMLNEVVANPGLYGFTNASAPACGTTPSLLCTAANLVTPNAAQTYVFADGVHPTTAAHAIIAQAVQSMITGPMQMAALGEAPMAVERANWRALDGRMMSSINAPGRGEKFQTWAAYDYAKDDIFGIGLSGSGDVNTISVGADMRVSGKMLAGIQFAYTEYKGDFGNNGGDFKLTEPTFTAYGGYGEGPWYVGATFGIGSLDYDTTRNIVLGAATRTETGTTKGYHLTGRLLGGYWLKYSNWDHGPFAKLTYEKIVVRQFSENGNDSTALNFDQQNNDAFLSSLGWQVSGVVSGFRPFARATWEYNFKDDIRQVTARPMGTNGYYTVPGFQPDDNWWLFDLGVSRDFGKVTGFLSGNTTAGKGDGDYWAVTVGIRVPL